MNYDTFIDLVQRRTDLGSEKAVDLIRGALETLAERITGAAALDLAAQLPAPLQPVLRRCDEAAQRFDAPEFVHRVARRTGLEPRRAEDGVRAVFATLHEGVTGGEFADIIAQLPADLAALADTTSAPVRR
jgi:uncharacterized protein (DUF2267 family)